MVVASIPLSARYPIQPVQHPQPGSRHTWTAMPSSGLIAFSDGTGSVDTASSARPHPAKAASAGAIVSAVRNERRLSVGRGVTGIILVAAGAITTLRSTTVEWKIRNRLPRLAAISVTPSTSHNSCCRRRRHSGLWLLRSGAAAGSQGLQGNACVVRAAGQTCPVHRARGASQREWHELGSSHGAARNHPDARFPAAGTDCDSHA